MKSGTLILLALFTALVNGHALVTHIHVNGKADSSCVRRPPNTDPIKDLSSVAMACNVNSDVGGSLSGKCPVKGMLKPIYHTPAMIS